MDSLQRDDAVARHDALSRRVAELERERDAALAVAAAERERNAVLLQQCDHLAFEVFALRTGRAPEWKPALVTEEARRLRLELDHANATIRNMERSWFWRMRIVTVRLRRVFRRSAG